MTEIFKTLPLCSLANWDIRNYFAKTQIVSRFPLCAVSSFMHRVKENITVQDTEQYKRVTIKTNGAGACLRDIVKGKNINTKKQFVVHTNQFLISKIDARNGAFGIVREDIEGAIITGNFWVYDVDEAVVLKEYLLRLLSCKRFQDVWKDCSNGSGNRLYLDEAKFCEYKLPIPPISQQRKILDEYRKLIKKADVFQQDVVKNIAETEDFVYNALNINKLDLEVKDEMSLLRFLKFSKLAKWDVARRNTTRAPSELFYSRTFKNKLLSDVCKINPTTSLSKFGKQEVTFLPMECVSAEDGEISAPKIGAADKSNGYTKFQEGDVLWAKITPCMQNGKCAVARNLINKVGYGSTEFNVFRANVDEIVPEYLHALLRMKNLRILAQEYFTGSSGQQRVSAEFFEELTIPVPNIQKQKEIAKHIANKKQEIRNKAEFASACRQQATEYFEKAVFILNG